MYRMRIKNMDTFIKNYNKFIPKYLGLEWDFLSYDEQTVIINALYPLEKNNRWRDVMIQANQYIGLYSWEKCVKLASEDLDLF